MRLISVNKIRDKVADLCIQANTVLRRDVLAQLQTVFTKEKNKRAKEILAAIIKNARIARREKLAICQDTGLPCVFVEIGQDVKVVGDLKSAINRGVELGYKKASLRNSVIADPLFRGSPRYSPVIMHFDLVKGNKIKMTVLPKGFGCENKTRLKMFKPTAKIDEIREFIVDAVKAAGPDACPPYIVGVGIGGTADYACLLAKKTLLRKLKAKSAKRKTLESEILNKINQLNIGPMGLGGRTTALAVNIATYPTHIAGLPVAVNISCHALRSASAVL